MSQAKDIKTPVFIGVIEVVVIVVGYFLWKGNAVSEPTIPPDQTVQKPFGNASPGRGGGGGGGTPTPGTASRDMGFGPSRNAPIPRR